MARWLLIFYFVENVIEKQGGYKKMIKSNIDSDILYLKSHGIEVYRIDNDYKITNAQGVSLKVTETAIINYVKQLKYDDKMNDRYLI